MLCPRRHPQLSLPGSGEGERQLWEARLPAWGQRAGQGDTAPKGAPFYPKLSLLSPEMIEEQGLARTPGSSPEAPSAGQAAAPSTSLSPTPALAWKAMLAGFVLLKKTTFGDQYTLGILFGNSILGKREKGTGERWQHFPAPGRTATLCIAMKAITPISITWK